MDTLQACLEDGSIVYYEGDAQPSFEETMPWSSTGENDPCSVRAEDYGIVYDTAQLPDWETVPLSYLCAYYLNGDGAYAEGAMDVLAHRYQQAPNTVGRISAGWRDSRSPTAGATHRRCCWRIFPGMPCPS